MKENSKGTTLLFGLTSVLTKVLDFESKKGIALRLEPKIGIYKLIPFLQKSKGYSLTFGPKLGICKITLFLQK